MLPFIGALMLSIFGNLLFAAMEVLAADTMQLIVDSFQSGNGSNSFGNARGILLNFLASIVGDDFNKVIWIPAIIVLIALFRGIGNFLGRYYIQVTGRNTIHSLRCHVFNHLLSQPASFFDSHTNAFLVSRITFNVEQVTAAVTRALMTVTREGLTVVGLLSYMFYQSWRLTLVFLIAVPFIALVVAYVSKRFRRISKRIQNSMGDVTHVSTEAVSANRVIKTFLGENFEQQRFESASEYNRVQSLKLAATDAAASPVMHFLIAMALGVIIAVGLSDSFVQELSSGTFVAFLTAAGLLAKPLRQLSNVVSVIQKGLAAADDLFSQLDLPEEVDTGDYNVERAQGNLKFSDINFAYEQNLNENILNNIDLNVTAGQTIALVGKTGSGKSTLVNLLPRFYDYQSGSILLDDVELKNYTLQSLRSQFALVNQGVTLFNDTIYNNIAYGSLRNKSKAEVMEAIKIAHVDEFLDKLPNGLETIVGDQGVLLSGGQRQRIAIARAILKDAPVLILDEATSALDNESERLIQDALSTVMEGRTCFVVAHRLSTIEQADLILVLEQGRIIEQGSHTELLAKQGSYAELHNSQFSES